MHNYVHLIKGVLRFLYIQHKSYL